MKKFKHFLGILLSGALLFALSACGQSAPPQSQAPAQNQESISAENSTEISPSEDSNPETAADAIKDKTLVVYYSATGSTKDVGYPIWWGIAAWPVDSFIASNDFSGKTVIPFCTSISSGLGQSGQLLAEAAETGDWMEGRRFSSGASASEVQEWVADLNLMANESAK